MTLRPGDLGEGVGRAVESQPPYPGPERLGALREQLAIEYRRLQPGFADDTVVHPHTDEAFYGAYGDATCQLGDRELPVTAGGLVFVSRGTAHIVWNSGDRSGEKRMSPRTGRRGGRVRPVEAG